MSGRLANKIALVTGGARGIGAAIVRRLAADGARVAFTYRDKQDDATTKGLSSGSLNDVTIRAGVKKGPVRLEAFVANALNDHTPTVATIASFEIPRPRTIGLELGYAF